MTHRLRHILTTVAAALLLVSCNEQGTEAVVYVTLNSAVTEPVVLQTSRVHYKFTDPVYLQAEQIGNNKYRFSTEIEKPQTVDLVLGNKTYPVYLSPGQQTNFSINIAHFPYQVNASGFGSNYYKSYNSFLDELDSANRHLRIERTEFVRGEENNYLNVKRLKIQLAKEYLADTPFSSVLYQKVGKYLTGRLDEIRQNKLRESFNLELARRSVLNEAIFLDFFSYKSLEAQRAGIRDFAHAWVQTFGIEERLKNDPSVQMVAGNWIRTAGNEAREHKLELLKYIDENDARAHAAMYLIAEEIGDYDYSAGNRMFEEYEDLLSGYPEYSRFLNTLSYEVGKTQPGNPAVEFSIENQFGQTVSLSDFRGSYVLLDFWASWCVPCIEEMPYLEELFNEYGRNDLEIVSLSLEESRELWENALERFPKPWTQLYDNAAFDQETFQAYRAGGIPFYVLIGRDGTIIRNNDFRPSGNLPEILDELLYNDHDHTYAGGR